MLQKRGWLTSVNCTVGTKLQQQFAQRAMSFNFHLTLIVSGTYQLLLSNKGAVTLSNSKGGFRGGPKGAFFP